MIKRFFKTTCLVWLSFVTIGKAQQINNDFVEGEIYVKLKPNFIRRGLVKLTNDVNIQSEIPIINGIVEKSNSKIEDASNPYFFSKNDEIKDVFRIKLDNEIAIEQVLKDLKEDPSVEYVERIRKREIISVPSDTLYSQQWFLDKIKAPDAWDVNPGVQDIIVAVVDNAFDITHPDLAANLVTGYDVGDNDADPTPPDASFSHGTHVAGIVAAVNNNITGIASAGNNRVKVMPIKGTTNAGGNRAITHGYEGVAYAVNQGAKIISLSWGGAGFSQLEQDVINDAYANGVMVIAAAGNEGNSILQYPAAYEHVVAVASLDIDDGLSSFSSYGAYVDISAPGRGILSTIPFNTYASFNGTSMATPLVSACAAYLRACFPTLSGDSLETILKITSDNIDNENPTRLGMVGTGRVNLLKAVACKGANLFAEQPTISPTNYLCEGDSALFDINAVSSESFEWFKDGLSVSNTKSFYAKADGTYKLVRTLGSCIVESDELKIIYNEVFTSKPSVTDLTTFYCDSQNNFVVASQSGTPANAFGPKEAIYTGLPVGFDGFLKSGDYPTVNVSGIAGLIDSVSISITWQKKDGGTHDNCDIPDGGGTAFNEEVSFSIVSPEGVEVDLVHTSDYGRGTASSGMVTTVFNVNGAGLVGDPLPSSGSFKAAGDLSVYEDKVPVGVWTLIANDDATLDPLCVSGFSVTIKTKQPAGSPTVKWFSDESLGTLLSVNDTLTVPTTTVGIQDYYAVAEVPGLCLGPVAKATVEIKTIPDIYAYPISGLYVNSNEIDALIKGSGISSNFNESGTTVSGNDKNNQPYSYNISSTAPQISPITLCATESYLLFGLGCNGTIEWKYNGIIKYGDGVVLNNVSPPLNVTATCLQDWSCPALVNIPFNFLEATTPLTLESTLIESSEQNYYGSPISSSQLIKENSDINYTAPNSISLNPGFESKLNTNFKAEIGNCPN
ncbi:S8 family serine peptidase [Arcticibacterium luteifluviistationis]|uniref:S8 family serine peptidase n=1 Tax=Arcticibacterium luteifluviistationis TaxID=1784714 RepID=UPI0013A6C941|nr:S8 family serine peptidase [Arcticibacterium luteifluviistationis]